MRARPLFRRPVRALLPRLIAVVPAIPVAATAALAGQGPVPETGAVRAGLLLRQMDGVKRVLLIAAHPDDEDTSLLAALARGRGARAAYLSLTRGEGGQNLVGSELGEALGLVRTGELLAARALDGAEQYFTRAYDFGYSKSARETFEHWPRDSLLSDVVWIVRTFRPQVIVSAFGGTERDGHGQHQAAGILAREAFEAAADPGRFPEQLAEGARPWTPRKLYRRTFWDPDSATLAVATGGLDPLLGRSHHQLAMESRSQHRSQDFGTAEHPGPRFSNLRLLRRAAEGDGAGRGAAPDTALFAGIDTTLASLAAGLAGERAERVRAGIEAYRARVHAARSALHALAPGRAVADLAGALEAARRIRRAAERAGPAAEPVVAAFRERERLATEALVAAAGITLTLRADDEVVVPGRSVGVAAEVWNGGTYAARLLRAGLQAPSGWEVTEAAPPPEPPWPPFRRRDEEEGEPAASDRGSEAGDEATAAGREEEAARGARELPPGSLTRLGFAASLPADAAPSRPYHLRRPRRGDLYRWPDDPALRGLPRAPSPLRGRVALEVEVEGRGVALELERLVRYRGVDKARGEFWRPLLVAPPLSVRVEPDVLLGPLGSEGPRTASVRLRAASGEALEGRVSLEPPEGWRAEPVERPFSLDGEGASAELPFRIVPAGPGAGEAGTHDLRAVASLPDGRTYEEAVEVVDHPHIDPWLHFEPAAAAFPVFPVRVREGRRVGYVMGSGDDVPAAIRQLGLEVETLDPARVAEGDFSGLDVVVLGIRAYETRPDLRRANGALLDWVRGGGTLLVQYNKYEYADGGFAPYPVSMRRPHDRVTDETAPVRILAPDAPAFREPNRIGPADFEGWVQERGLYFLGEWDPTLVPLLEMADPGEAPKRGSLLAAPLGEGVYVYTGLAFFRQLPAGVPGAYRLFANLLSATPAEWRVWLEGRGGDGGP